jgi:hypothetical protein
VNTMSRLNYWLTAPVCYRYGCSRLAVGWLWTTATHAVAVCAEHRQSVDAEPVTEYPPKP